MLDHSCQVQRHALSERRDDLYETPRAAVEALLRHERLPHRVALLRLAFMESERRSRILEGRGLAQIHVFRRRLPMMHRHGWEGRKANSGMAFAWFVWDRAHSGTTAIDRISWEAERKGGAQGTRRIRSRPARPRGPAPRTADLFSCRQGGSGDMPDIPLFLRRAP
jgi:hypothetical protein